MRQTAGPLFLFAEASPDADTRQPWAYPAPLGVAVPLRLSFGVLPQNAALTTSIPHRSRSAVLVLGGLSSTPCNTDQGWFDRAPR